MTKKIKQMYTKAGLTPPNGKGIHTEKFHSCVIKLKKKKQVKNPYAVCMKSLGRERAIKQAHMK